MKEHRVRKISSPKPNENPNDIYFVEIRKDEWIPVEPFERKKGIHAMLHDTFDNEHIMTYDSRAFNIGLVENWIKCEPIVQ
ncbi:MAG TPA: hypothetical protein VMW53_07445 [archaeon]|nr:hypothetical protein [archaeon]